MDVSGKEDSILVSIWHLVGLKTNPIVHKVGVKEYLSLGKRAVEEAGRVTLSSCHHPGEHARARSTWRLMLQGRDCAQTLIAASLLMEQR